MIKSFVTNCHNKFKKVTSNEKNRREMKEGQMQWVSVKQSDSYKTEGLSKISFLIHSTLTTKMNHGYHWSVKLCVVDKNIYQRYCE